MLESIGRRRRCVPQPFLYFEGLTKFPLKLYGNPILTDTSLIFPHTNGNGHDATTQTVIHRFDKSRDPEGVESHVPHMDHFYDNHLQSGLMRDLALDLEVLGENVILLGNQARKFPRL